MTGIKMLIIAALSYLGIRRFSPELFEDFRKHAVEYSVSVLSGLFAYMKIPFEIDYENPFTVELIKMSFAILTVVFVIPVQFVVRKIIDRIYVKFFKNKK